MPQPVAIRRDLHFRCQYLYGPVHPDRQGLTIDVHLWGFRLKIRGILFDKDGTLIDFQRTWMPAYRAALETLCTITDDPTIADRCLADSGFDAISGEVRANSPLACHANDDIAEQWLGLAGLPGNTEARTHIVGVMETYAATKPAPIFDVAALFEDLAGRDLHIGVATMDGEWVARASLSALHADHEVAFIAGWDSGHGKKPAPGMALAFCQATGLEPGEIVVVGDSLHDLHMGRNAEAGMVVGVRSGVARHEDLAADADHMLDDASQIGTLLS